VKYRIGIGYDMHRLVSNRKLIIGGVHIPSSKGLSGHSDADVLLHAITDAILGAAGEPDIGELFPDTDARFKGVSSLQLLKSAYSKAKSKSVSIINVDAVIIIEKPKIAKYKNLMRKKVSTVLGIGVDCVNIKAKTREGLSNKAVEAYAVTLIKKI